MDRENESLSPTTADLIEIRDPEIDTSSIMERVRQRVERRRGEKGYQVKDFPSFDGVGIPIPQDGAELDPNLFHYLELVNQSFYDFETEIDVQLSPATRGRILGRVWSLIRRQAHQLVLFYVNRTIEHQVAVNRQLVSIVNLLTKSLQEQGREMADLRRQLEGQANNDEQGLEADS